MTLEGPVAERRALLLLRASGTVMLVLSIAIMAVLPMAPVRANVPGFTSPIVGFELAATPSDLANLLGDAGTPERATAAAKMDLGNRLDFPFMVAYALLHVGIALLLAARQRLPRGTLQALLVLAALMAPFDALENRELLFLSTAEASPDVAASLERLRIFTLIKWYAIFGFAALVVPYAWRERGWWRWSAMFFTLGAIAGFGSVFYLPGIEYGAYLVAVAWLMAYLHAWQRPQLG